MSWEGGRRSGLLGSTVKRMMFVHARLMKFDRVLLIDRYRLTSRKIRHEKEVQHEDFPGARLTREVPMGSSALVLGMIAPCQVLRDQWLYGFDKDTRLTCDA
ncbi:unnamed protein product [Sphenostylis stenocarpa]|uniref:Uncharacterized protein n=1 Tax=Sphenostylis stenocarpa TaxID=92480 RepID=A0AA86V5Z7_9FABA|nr:unnamed protein product [Sphenostylis stenocarpa]